MILVDSSVWIACWRGKDATITALLSQLIESQQAKINWLIRTELLQGAKDRKHQNELKKLLEPVEVDPFPQELWEEAPLFYLEAREDGITLTTMDCLIATHAQLSRMRVWSLDQVFKSLKRISLFQPG